MTTWLGLDIGGANLKAALASGRAASLRFALWKRPDDLADEIAHLVAEFPAAEAIALTMTAELCDCFATKADGVRAVLNAVRTGVGDRPVRVWGIDGKFHAPEVIGERPMLAAASNWLALATFAARLCPDGSGLLIDVGSTTTDLIPLRDGLAEPIGRTDAERLRSGSLVYAGVRRTPICAVGTELPWRGGPIGLAAELFATTLDVYLTLGAIPPDPLDLDTADGRAATLAQARDRLARMVCADREEFSEADAIDFARSADLALFDRLCKFATCLVPRPRRLVVSGSGEFLARRVAERVGDPGATVVSLAETWGDVASVAACAFAVAKLAEQGV